MQATLIIFMVIAALATLGVLARGIIIMARGKDVTGEQSNKMMTYRVAFQFLAIVFIIILFLPLELALISRKSNGAAFTVNWWQRIF